ncbi:MAG: mandelate racemase/muconate lactonizing enzyme family protein [Bacteroidota bacterium]
MAASSSRITDVEAYWLRAPIPEERQHRSDFGLLTHFDATVVVVTTADGRKGYGEAKAAVGSTGSGASIVTCVRSELRPLLIGQDARHINRLWEVMYNDTRAHYALQHGRGFPVLGRRGLLVSAMSGVDTALWDLAGQRHAVPVVELLGGACRDHMPAYASGGWADAEGIGPQLEGYTQHGFRAVKMRVGIMDGSVANSVARVQAARDHLGPDIGLMVDAHGTMSVPQARRFCRQLEDVDLRWFEEPVNSDNRVGLAEVRAQTTIPIAAGESEFTRFDIRDLIDARCIDVAQPDAAIIGGITETMRVCHLAHAYQVEVAPHLWGSALSFHAGLHIAFAAPAAVILEFSLGGNPMLHEMIEEPIAALADGTLPAPTRPGLGVTVRQAFLDKYAQ